MMVSFPPHSLGSMVVEAHRAAMKHPTELSSDKTNGFWVACVRVKLSVLSKLLVALGLNSVPRKIVTAWLVSARTDL
jgi:hypothetical protein